jgi:hypothetical protein
MHLNLIFFEIACLKVGMSSYIDKLITCQTLVWFESAHLLINGLFIKQWYSCMNGFNMNDIYVCLDWIRCVVSEKIFQYFPIGSC